MILFFRDYDNGWKYLKRIGAVLFVSAFAQNFLKDKSLGIGIGILLMIVGLALYIWGKWMNYSCELCTILEISTYSQAEQKMEQWRQEIYDSLPSEDAKKEFMSVYFAKAGQMPRAVFLKEAKYRTDKPQWMS